MDKMKIREKYNSIYREEIPCVTPHVCRHTFASKMARSGMNPKTLQLIMGHSEIGVTLNVYTHLVFVDLQHDFATYFATFDPKNMGIYKKLYEDMEIVDKSGNAQK
mgnify:CR=1 FL=1